ncbi:hypothetical protein GOP47_0019342 [Adiantum capillus-veneris]|uniref:Uncharacterized protein n=1 Tax=Adiantum capillus-veneris TaxID=13818 RepID=A0A9D4UEX6_ADICA|nr:hypothetical protein GOP47_0019342 [Adiantum capillus-veneris]
MIFLSISNLHHPFEEHDEVEANHRNNTLTLDALIDESDVSLYIRAHPTTRQCCMHLYIYFKKRWHRSNPKKQHSFTWERKPTNSANPPMNERVLYASLTSSSIKRPLLLLAKAVSKRQFFLL